MHVTQLWCHATMVALVLMESVGTRVCAALDIQVLGVIQLALMLWVCAHS